MLTEVNVQFVSKKTVRSFFLKFYLISKCARDLFEKLRFTHDTTDTRAVLLLSGQKRILLNLSISL
ncbi:hypothetical protein T4C_7267 [Trichinella pseudospiralis]|uniref:Uncharacterized protein n=1 Tax=Trichinella pseudospiralis TaxID=6337 RepID=A0A0V1J9S7_TRIPS|nr:hypothetical protein T4C_7267 [Trichinella pseudospiralis]